MNKTFEKQNKKYAYKSKKVINIKSQKNKQSQKSSPTNSESPIIYDQDLAPMIAVGIAIKQNQKNGSKGILYQNFILHAANAIATANPINANIPYHDICKLPHSIATSLIWLSPCAAYKFTNNVDIFFIIIPHYS